jgi:hypothetical protein
MTAEKDLGIAFARIARLERRLDKQRPARGPEPDPEAEHAEWVRHAQATAERRLADGWWRVHVPGTVAR